jgi:hypothetical protein
LLYQLSYELSLSADSKLTQGTMALQKWEEGGARRALFLPIFRSFTNNLINLIFHIAFIENI